jgi:four helix bundle protein
MNSEGGTRNSEGRAGRTESADRSLKNANDLKARTFEFSLRIMRFAEGLPETRGARTIANQVIRSGTSVGANYRAARRAKSTKDFISKMGTVEEECDETIYWIELAVASGCVSLERVDSLIKEGNELLAITVASIRTAKEREK